LITYLFWLLNHWSLWMFITDLYYICQKYQFLFCL